MKQKKKTKNKKQKDKKQNKKQKTAKINLLYIYIFYLKKEMYNVRLEKKFHKLIIDNPSHT